MSFKVGDKVRVKGAKPVGKITNIYTDGKWLAQFDDWLLFQGEIEALGIELELVEPELPEEPPMGSVIRFGGRVYERRGLHWYTVNSTYVYKWQQLIGRFRTDFTVLEERDKTIREVLVDIYGKESIEFREQAEYFGVSLDDH